MARYLGSFTYTPRWLNALARDPQDREPALRGMLEAGGAKLLAYYVDPTAATAYLIIEADDPGAADPVIFQVFAGGMIDIAASSFVRILTSAEFAEVARQASKGGYTPPAAG